MSDKIISVQCIAALAILPAYTGDFDPEAFIMAHNKWRANAGVKELRNYAANAFITPRNSSP
jgi:hypothetical protein